MKKTYLINEYKGFNKIFDREGIEQNKRAEILKGLDFISVRVEIEKRDNGYFEFIYNAEGNRLKLTDFNSYHRSLINNCFNHFIALRDNLNECIEVI